MAEQPNEDDLCVEGTPGYKPPEQKSVQQLLDIDQDDESLRKYKESLLGKPETCPCKIFQSCSPDVTGIDCSALIGE